MRPRPMWLGPEMAARGILTALLALTVITIPHMVRETNRYIAYASAGQNAMPDADAGRIQTRSQMGGRAGSPQTVRAPAPDRHTAVAPWPGGRAVLTEPLPATRWRDTQSPAPAVPAPAVPSTAPDRPPEAAREAGFSPIVAQSDSAASGAFALAQSGYAAVRMGDRRAAARLWQQALSQDPQHESAARWQAELDQLTRQVRASLLLQSVSGPQNDGSLALPGAASGQVQSVTSAAFRTDPLAHRPVDITGRWTRNWKGRRESQLALGLEWRPLGVMADGDLLLGVERRLAVVDGTDQWALRLAGGRGHGYGPAAGADDWVHWSAYGEAVKLGFGRAAAAGGQAQTGYGRRISHDLTVTALAGGWAYGEIAPGTGSRMRGRLTAGPGVEAQSRLGSLQVRLRADYRWQVTGTLPDQSGPALTLTVGY